MEIGDRHAYSCSPVSAPYLFLMALAVALGLVSGTRLAPATQNRDGAKEIYLRTDFFPSPLDFPRDKSWPVYSVKIAGRVPAEGDGSGEVLLDDRKPTFNQFGDGRVEGAPSVEAKKVVFRRVTGRAYDIVFRDGSLAGRMRLVLQAGVGSHRLLIYGENPTNRGARWCLLSPLELYGQPQIKEALSDAPVQSYIWLTTIGASPDGPRRISIRGVPGGDGALDLDGNYLEFNAVGEVMWTTSMAYPVHRVSLKKLDAPDPAKKGRRLYEVVADGANQGKYLLVLGRPASAPCA